MSCLDRYNTLSLEQISTKSFFLEHYHNPSLIYLAGYLTLLEFGERFNQSLTAKIIPKSVTQLTLPYRYLCDPKLYKSPIPSVNQITIIASKYPTLPVQLITTHPPRLYDLLQQFTNIVVRLGHGLGYNDPKPIELSVRMLDQSTIIWFDKQK
eukprot:gene15974-18996_t